MLTRDLMIKASYVNNMRLKHYPFSIIQEISNRSSFGFKRENRGIEQITKADRDAWHALRRYGKARTTLRRLSSTVRPSSK